MGHRSSSTKVTRQVDHESNVKADKSIHNMDGGNHHDNTDRPAVITGMKCSSTLNQSSEHNIHQKDGETSVVRL